MTCFIRLRAPFAFIALASLLAGCDPASTEVGATVADDGASGDDEGSGGSGATAGSGDGSSGDDGTTDGSLECEQGAPLVSGTVHRELEDHTWNEAFEPTAEAHVVMRLYTYVVDGPSTTIATHDVPFETLPFDFVICGDPEAAFADGGGYDVEVNVYNHEGDEYRVADLIDEYHDEVDGPTEGLEIVVTGLEHCDEPYAGGYCTTVE